MPLNKSSRACTYYAAQTVVLLHNTLSRARGGGRGSSALLAKGSPGDTKGGLHVGKILEQYRKSISWDSLSIAVFYTNILLFIFYSRNLNTEIMWLSAKIAS